MPTQPLRVGLGALLCVLSYQMSAQYALTVEPSPAVGNGGTVYRFYVNAEDPTDKISAVYGTDVDNIVINTPSGIFNSPFNAGWNAAGINPAFLTAFPDMADDSYATIGLVGTRFPRRGRFCRPRPCGGRGLEPFGVRLFPDRRNVFERQHVDGGILVRAQHRDQCPSCGRTLAHHANHHDGQHFGKLNYQVFPLGEGDDQVRITNAFDGAGTFPMEDVPGCTDSSACNYDEDRQRGRRLMPILWMRRAIHGIGIHLDRGSKRSHRPRPDSLPFYVDMMDASDTFSAVFGNSEQPLLVNVPSGAFNTGFNSSWNASGINPAFWPCSPKWRTTRMPPLV